ncbi:MAG: TonB-dependent receptor [Acidobacteriota bacterium]|nr:TonB-dependent receptor [Acidobacteriota bacterium]
MRTFSFVTQLCVVWTLLSCVVRGAQPSPAIVEGVVVDGVTRVPIAGANVARGTTVVNTGSDGRFTIEAEGGATLRVTADGYLETDIDVDDQLMEVLLFRVTFTERVEVVSERVTQERPSATPVAPEAVFRAPGSIDNVFRTLDTLAGVASTDDFGSRLAVRGGTPDQNLTIMDGVEVHNPYRLFGIASAFNPETVERFELTAGGFGVAYGDRLSSLLVVDNRAGRPGFHGSTAASVTDANLVLEGTTPGGHEGTWLLSARRTYYDLVVGRLEDQNFPSFADLQLQTRWEIGPGHRLTLTGLRSVEDADLDIDFDRPDERAALGSDVTNGLASARFDAVLGTQATASTVVSWYRNREALSFDGLIRADARRSNAVDDEVGFARDTIAFDRVIRVGDVSVRQDVSTQVSPRHLLNVGVELHRLDTGVGLSIAGDRSDTEANGSSVQGGAGLPDQLDSRLYGTRGGLWLQDTFTPSAHMSFEPGVRLDWSTVNGGVTVSPRVAARYRLSDQRQLRMAAGLYTQSPGYEKLTQSDYFIDLSGVSDLGLRHEKATHVVAGVEQTLGPDVTVRLEGYYKRFNDLLLGRLETETERLVRVARYDFPSPLQDSVPTAPIIVSTPSNTVGGRAYGLDLFLAHTNASAPLTGWMSYTWGRADRDAYGRRYPFEYDRRHAFNAVGRYRLTGRWDVAATIRVASGFPHTAPIGLRVASTRDERDRLVPATDTIGNLVYAVDYGDVANLNAGRLPHYARVDLRATYERGGPSGPWSRYIEVINLLGRDNPVVLEPRLHHDPNAVVPRLSEVPSRGFPRIPTFGIRVRF